MCEIDWEIIQKYVDSLIWPIVGLIVLFGFMYIYGVYKSDGLKVLEVVKNPGMMQEITDSSGRTPERTLLADMGRSDIQSYVLYRLSEDDCNYRYKFGSTYLSGLTILIPGSIRPKLYGKSEAGFELIKGSPSLGERASRVYGLAGEAMLNFGPAGIPFAFALFAWIVSRCRAFMMRLETGDARFLLYPFIINVLLQLLAGGFVMIVFFFK